MAKVLVTGGTGKTSSVGYLLATHALRNGWHVVILDADNGNAWTPFAAHAEHVEADAETLPSQMAALYDEFQRRSRLLADAGAADMLAMPDAPPRVLAVVEEYGDLRHTLGLRDARAAATVDGQLDTILRRGRKCGVHVALLDQYPEHWSQQVLAGVKWLAVFRLGPNQGSKVEEYKAHQLPQRGAFLVHGVQYTAWHTAPAVRQLLADVPALPVGARLLTGSSRLVHSGGGGGATSGEQPYEVPMKSVYEAPVKYTPSDMEGWYQWTLDNYFPTHPELLQTDDRGRGVGIQALAEAMADENGKTVDAMLGVASGVGKRLRADIGFRGGEGKIYGMDEKGEPKPQERRR
jgi:NAD(P)-dependent dehydrogenase (short-subunit alcohol dehydrogenase family)